MDLPYLDAMTNNDERDWRKLCELAANETDPRRLRALVEQLSKALESRTKKRESDPDNRKDPLKSSKASARSKVVVMKGN
jgi:predicted transcriptional regulator of viral defense system